jgi:hypothetical protein
VRWRALALAICGFADFAAQLLGHEGGVRVAFGVEPRGLLAFSAKRHDKLGATTVELAEHPSSN